MAAASEDQRPVGPAYPLLAMLAGVSAWLWPIGVGGKMPVGGDVTSFSMGLMACLSRAIHAGRLPLWNDLWGFGFPGLAESQMGVYYPPHLVLYGLFSTELAYTANLALHAYWAAMGGFWMARKFGVTAWGAALSGFVFATSGIFVIHLSHHWSYTTASWMPWAWGLAWLVSRGEGTTRTAALLAASLAIQILPGHFQFAFITQVGVIAIAMSATTWRAVLQVFAALIAAAPLTAMQLWPTWQLARLAESQRDFDYLSAFASPPLHLISYVAPNLFHESALWRSIVWTPLHAMPEEHRAYVGLIPLWLALGAIRRGFRRDRATRVLAMLAALTLLLSLGPYIPGFSLLIRLPGFSFFRAPARWGMATALAMAVLAGKGWDAWQDWPRRGRAAARFALIAAFSIAILIGLFELALASTEGVGIPAIAGLFEKARQALPWRTKADPTFRQVMAGARSSPVDPQAISGLMKEGVNPSQGLHMRLDRERFSIYFRELAETGGLILALLVAAPLLARRSRPVPAILFGLVVIDLLLLSRHREIRPAPIRPLTEQSSTLARLAGMPARSRTVDNLRNLPMIATASPLVAYRTLDRPAMYPLTYLPFGSLGPKDQVAALRAVGASVRIFDPFESRDERVVEEVSDPTLTGWIYGEKWLASPEGKKRTTFAFWKPVKEPSWAWFLANRDRPAGGFPSGTDPPWKILPIFEKARPLPLQSAAPERFETELDSDGPGLVIFSILDDPEWQARVIGPEVRGPSSRSRFSPPGRAAPGNRWRSRAPATGEWPSNIAGGRRSWD